MHIAMSTTDRTEKAAQMESIEGYGSTT